MNTPQEYFELDDAMYHKDCIEWVRVDGGAWGFGCWGQIKLKHEDQPRDIGDGSYHNDGIHKKHSKTGWSFWRIKQIMRDALGENCSNRQHEGLAALRDTQEEVEE